MSQDHDTHNGTHEVDLVQSTAIRVLPGMLVNFQPMLTKLCLDGLKRDRLKARHTAQGMICSKEKTEDD